MQSETVIGVESDLETEPESDYESESERRNLNRERLREEEHVRSSLELIEQLTSSISRKEPLEKSLEYLVGRTKAGFDRASGKPLHKACVCVICDCFIKGTEPI